MTFGEIKKGIDKAQDSRKKETLQMWLQDFMIPRFWLRVISIDGAVALAWGVLIAKHEKVGRLIPSVGSLITASAIIHRLQVVTRNTKDFEGLGIQLVNPWD